MNNRLTARERAHIQKVKELPCSVCDAPGPSDADSWVDIAGYAKLVADRLNGVAR